MTTRTLSHIISRDTDLDCLEASRNDLGTWLNLLGTLSYMFTAVVCCL